MGSAFFAVVLYIAVEPDLMYKVDPRDALNHKVLHQANLVVDLNDKSF